jgi:NAD(P)-dependent dehydrogenase (short-subunit alcohol dehydrogenase family)
VSRVLITAGATGIGLAMARAFATRGDRVWVTDVDVGAVASVPSPVRPLRAYPLPWLVLIGLLVFFIAFNILEASLPSLISRLAPASSRGLALGIYNTTQSVGLAAGALAGGWLAQHHGSGSVFLFAAVGLPNRFRHSRAAP